MSPDALPQPASAPAAGSVEPAPSLCRMVLVHERRTLDKRTFAAVVTAVHVPGPRGVIALTAFPPAQQAYPIPSVPHESNAGDGDAYAWSWPPRS